MDQAIGKNVPTILPKDPLLILITQNNKMEINRRIFKKP